MLNLRYTPRPPLSDFVALLWLYEGYTQPHPKERLLPDGSMELVFNLRQDSIPIYDPQNHDSFQTFPGSVVCGPHSQFFVIDTANQNAVIGVHFKPGGAFPFLKLPASELHNQVVSLDALWGPAAGEIREQLLGAATPEAKFRVLERQLVARIARPLARHPAVACALREFHCMPHIRTISEVTDQIGLSPRRFIEVFKAEAGLAPKTFCRVRRFQEVVRLTRRAERVEWADVALACGYYDQAHFIHDFRAFSGLNPSTYLLHRGTHHNHVPIQD